MSEAAAGAPDENQKQKKQCVVFEPQAWRKTLCRNCFKTKNDHPSGASDAVDEQRKQSTSPVGNDDYVVIGRREGTPLKDRSRSSTPTASSTPSSTPTTTPTTAGKNTPTPERDTATLVGKEKDNKTNRDSQADKEKDKTRSEVDSKSQPSKAGGKSDAAAVAKSEVQKKQNQSSAGHVKDKKTEEAKKPVNVNPEQIADSKPAADKQTAAAAALSQAAENNKTGKAVNIQGHGADASQVPTTNTAADGPGAVVGNAVNSSAAINKNAGASSASAVQPKPAATESSRSESGHHGNASSSQVTPEWSDTQKPGDSTIITTRGASVIDEVGSSSGDTDAGAASATATAAADSRSSDEIIGSDVARSGKAGRPAAAADVTKIDLPGSVERSAAGVGQEDAVAGGPGAATSREKLNAEDAAQAGAVRQPDQDVSDASVPASKVLFTNDDVANSSSSAALDTTCASSSSISQPATTAVHQSDSIPQQSTAFHNGASATTGNDSTAPPELTSCNSAEAAGHSKVEATITLSDASSSVDSSRPIHIVSAAGISSYQQGGSDWTTASQNVEDSEERSRLPPDYDQSASAGCSSTTSSVSSSDDAVYGPTSPLVEYLSRSPFARSLHGAVERSPETEIVAPTGGSGGGETSLFHHVPATAADGEKFDTAAGGVGVADTRDWETEQSRNGGVALKSATDSDSDSRLFNIFAAITIGHTFFDIW